MRNLNTNSVEANQAICQGVNVFAIDTYSRTALDRLRLLSSGLWNLAISALAAHCWQLVPSVVQAVGVTPVGTMPISTMPISTMPMGGTAETGRRQAMQPERMPAKLG